VPTREIETYVRAALVLHGYRLDETGVAQVVGQFERIAVIARVLFDGEFPESSEPAESFRP
jgi:Protein of unknown function (DUF4089)